MLAHPGRAGRAGRPGGLNALKPARDFNFAGLSFPTGGMTFTRATAATVTDHQGVVWQTQSGEMRIAGARRVENLLLSTGTLLANTFTALGAVVDTATQATLASTAASRVEKRYTTSMTGRTTFAAVTLSGSGTVTLRLVDFGGAFGSTDLTIPLTATPTRYSVSRSHGVDGAGGVLVQVSNYSGQALSVTATDWELELAAPGQVAPSEYVSRGVLSSPFHGYFADGVRYFATNAAGAPIAPQGVLIEDGSTNAIRNSTMLGASPGVAPTSWLPINAGSSGLAVSHVGAGVENGLAYTDIRLNGTAVAGQAYVFFESNTQIAAAAGQAWTSSLYYRIVSAPAIAGLSIISHDLRGLTAGAAFVSNTTTGLSAASFTLQRSAVSITTIATTAFVVNGIVFATVAGAVDITIRVYAPQLEQKEFATSFVPTSTVAASRNSDMLQMLGADVWFNQQAGTVVHEGRFGAGSTSGYPALFCFGRNVLASNEFTGFCFPSNIPALEVKSATVLQLNSQAPAPFANEALFKFAAAMALNDAQSAMAGALGSADTSGVLPTLPLDRVSLGSFAGRGETYGGGSQTISRWRYWPRRLPNATLQALTA
jgi:hypothetical protein